MGPDYRGLWGLFGSYEYLSPQVFRLATTTVRSHRGPVVALAHDRAAGDGARRRGLGASGTVADPQERDYHYGVIPSALVGLRLIFGERAMLEGAVRQYFVAGLSSGSGESDSFGPRTSRGHGRIDAAPVRPHALGCPTSSPCATRASRTAATATSPSRR